MAVPSYSPTYAPLAPPFLDNSSQHFIRLLPLLLSASAVKSNFPPILSFFDRLLAVLAAVKSPTAIVVTELLSRVIGDELFVAFSALGHGLTYLSILTVPSYHRKR
jgi:hypothetical protein